MPRIVSLIASATEIIHALGMGTIRSGVLTNVFPAAVLSLPVCTAPKFSISGNSQELIKKSKATLSSVISVYEVFEDILEQLRPTHIITQSQCEVCAVSLRDVEQAVAGRLGCDVQIVSLEPNCLDDIWNDIRSVSESLQISKRGDDLMSTLQAKLRTIAPAGLAQTKPRVACLEWIDARKPGTGFRAGRPGGESLFGEAGKHSLMTWEQ
jgi:iron complex transport system substrate-binding protein